MLLRFIKKTGLNILTDTYPNGDKMLDIFVDENIPHDPENFASMEIIYKRAWLLQPKSKKMEYVEFLNMLAKKTKF